MLVGIVLIFGVVTLCHGETEKAPFWLKPNKMERQVYTFHISSVVSFSKYIVRRLTVDIFFPKKT